MGRICATSRLPRCAVRSRSSVRMSSCSLPRWRTTSPMAIPGPKRTPSKGQAAMRSFMPMSTLCPNATARSSANAARPCQAGSGSGCPSHARCWWHRKSLCSTIPPPRSTPAPSGVFLLRSAGRDRRITILVAHRLSTLADADRILVLEQGRIVEQGNHAELMALGGRYRSLHDLQNRSYGDRR